MNDYLFWKSMLEAWGVGVACGVIGLLITFWSAGKLVAGYRILKRRNGKERKDGDV